MYRRNTVKPMKPVLKRDIRRFQTLPGKWSVVRLSVQELGLNGAHHLTPSVMEHIV